MFKGNSDSPVVSVKKLIGRKVLNSESEAIGRVKDVVVDLSYGRIAYAILKLGGIWGFGERFYAVPWDALIFDSAEKDVILEVDESLIQLDEGFDKYNWPDMADYKWGLNIYSHYGYRPYWE